MNRIFPNKTPGKPTLAGALARIGDSSGLREAGGATMSLSVPIVSVQDGPRMSGKIGNFGGKKAAPFGKGGKRVVAKALAKKARKDKDKDGD